MSHYKPYPAYRDSGVEWIGQVPEHWQVTPLKVIAGTVNGATPESGKPEYWDGDIAWYTPTDIDNEVASELGAPRRYITQAGYESCAVKLSPPGSVILSTRAPIGSVGTTTIPSTINQGCRTLIPAQDVPTSYLASTLVAAREELRLRGNGTTFQELSTEALRSLRVPMPPRSECVSIACGLDRETTRIDALIAKKTRFIELLKEKITALASAPPDSPNLKWVRLSHVCEVISRPVFQQAGSSYTRLGLFNRGRGVFKRDETDTEDMGDSEFFWVQPGDLILSGQFAWEGAVALVNEEHAGCVVSHRFPVIRGRNNEALTEYLLAYFLTGHGNFVLNDCSRGSAGRNRPLNMSLLLGWKIPIPSMQIQREIARLVQLERRIGEKVNKSIALLKERRSAFITAAVTGQIDLRESA